MSLPASAISRVSPDTLVVKPKASTGTTFQHVAELVTTALSEVKPALGTNVNYNSQLQRIKALMDGLYNGVRLESWSSTTVNSPAVAAFQLPVDGGLGVLVTDFTVELVKGLRRFPIADRLEASALFKALEQAQAVVTTRMTSMDIPDEEYFQESDPEGDSAALDEMLQDREYTEGTRSVESPALYIPDAEPQKYDPSKEPKKARPTMSEEEVQRHFKSLQGRVLTVIEASLADKEQRAAVKTLMNKEFRRQMEKVSRYFMFPNQCETSDEE